MICRLRRVDFNSSTTISSIPLRFLDFIGSIETFSRSTAWMWEIGILNTISLSLLLSHYDTFLSVCLVTLSQTFICLCICHLMESCLHFFRWIFSFLSDKLYVTTLLTHIYAIFFFFSVLLKLDWNLYCVKLRFTQCLDLHFRF